MPDFLYRFDIYLPIKDNSGFLIPPNKFRKIKNQMIKKFGGLKITSMWGNPTYSGFWRSPETNILYQDKNSIFTVFAPQTEESINFFIGKKEVWKNELQQEELLITIHELQTL